MAHTLNSSIQEQRQLDLCEFKASLTYKVAFRDSLSYIVRPCLKQYFLIRNKQKQASLLQGPPDPKALLWAFIIQSPLKSSLCENCCHLENRVHFLACCAHRSLFS